MSYRKIMIDQYYAYITVCHHASAQFTLEINALLKILYYWQTEKLNKVFITETVEYYL